MGKVTTLFEDSAKTIELYPRTKTSAVSDSDGNTLGNIAVWNALDVVSGVNAVKVGLDMDLLWENGNPTGSFASQTISLDLSNYELILVSIVANNTNNTGARVTAILRKTAEIQRMFICSDYIYYRDISSISNNGITFEGGRQTTTYGSPATNDSRVIPISIYGIRGQINDLTGD